MNMVRFGWMVAVLGLTMPGCGSDDDKGEASSALEIIGEYEDNFGSEQIITADDWNGAAIEAYDNADNVVYTQNAEDAEYNPSKYAKTVYTQPEDDSFYFCTVVFDADTLADAQDSDATADDSDPGTTGCGGNFVWTLATKKE